MGEKEEKKDKEVTVQEDKNDKDIEETPWGTIDPDAGDWELRLLTKMFSVELDKVKPLEKLGYYDTDKNDKDIEETPWGIGDSDAGDWELRLLTKMFSVELDKVKPLEKLGYYDTMAVTLFGGLIKKFKDHKRPLSSDAYVLTLASGNLWKIIDGDKKYEIRRNKLKKLNIYSEKASFEASFKKT